MPATLAMARPQRGSPLYLPRDSQGARCDLTFLLESRLRLSRGRGSLFAQLACLSVWVLGGACHQGQSGMLAPGCEDLGPPSCTYGGVLCGRTHGWWYWHVLLMSKIYRQVDDGIWTHSTLVLVWDPGGSFFTGSWPFLAAAFSLQCLCGEVSSLVRWGRVNLSTWSAVQRAAYSFFLPGWCPLTHLCLQALDR